LVVSLTWSEVSRNNTQNCVLTYKICFNVIVAYAAQMWIVTTSRVQATKNKYVRRKIWRTRRVTIRNTLRIKKVIYYKVERKRIK